MDGHFPAKRRSRHLRRDDGWGVRAALFGVCGGLSVPTLRRAACARLIAALSIALLLTGHPGAAEPSWRRPVKVVADARLTVTTRTGSGVVPLFLSADWSRPLPSIRRVVIVVHGIDRDADVYLRGAEAAVAAAGPSGQDTLLIAPQFVADIDVATYHLAGSVLHWDADKWQSGQPAHGPAPLSSFDVFDAILQRLADPALLPTLAHVVLVGHSAGGQVVQRYSVVGRGGAALAARGVTLRYVVANPSSYLYFSDDRPVPVERAACPGFDHWRYGLPDAPPYVGDTTRMEADFISRDVIYLLGTADTDPHHPDLDTSCGGEAEGPYRLARGLAYFAYLQARHPGMTTQRLVQVPGVAHHGGAMLRSVCGLAALFDRPGCPAL
jgi:hypothetical protein